MARYVTPAVPAARAAAEALGARDFTPIEAVAAWMEGGRTLPAGEGLLSLWRSANPEVDRLGDPALDPDPGTDALAAWAAMAARPPEVDPETDASRIGWMVGVIRDRHLYRGDEQARAAGNAFVDRLAAALSACDDPAVQLAGLARIGATPPVRALVDAAIARLAAEARRAKPSAGGFEEDLGRAAWLLAGAAPPTAVAVPAERCELAAAIETAPRDVLAWIDDDPLAVAKAIAREADDPAGWLDLLDGTRLAVARHAREVTGVAWQAAIAAARGAAITGEASPRGTELVEAGEAQAAEACARIATAVAACRAGVLPADRLIELVIAQVERAPSLAEAG